MRSDTDKNGFVMVLRLRRVMMLPVDTHLAVPVSLEVVIPADIERFWREGQQRSAILLEQFADQDPFLVVNL